MGLIGDLVNGAKGAASMISHDVGHAAQAVAQPIVNQLAAQAAHPVIQQNAPRVVALSTSPETAPLHTPQQIQTAVGQSMPMGSGSFSFPLNPYTNAQMLPKLQSLNNQAMTDRLNNRLSSMPVPANNGGALPPQMVNVPWSSQQVPYGTPTPSWYHGTGR